MINKDRIVPVTATDLLTFFYTVQASAGDKYVLATTSEIGVYDFQTSLGGNYSSNYICSEPVKKMNIGSAFQGSIYFIPDYDFEGITYNGTAAALDPEGDEIIADGASYYVAYYNTDASAVTVMNFSAVGKTGAKIDATPQA